MKVLVTQSCLTFYNPMDFSSPGSSVHGILQARILEWVAIPSSRGASWPRDWMLSSMAGRSHQGSPKNPWRDGLCLEYAYASEVKVKSLSRVRLFETPWTVAHQAPPSMGFSKQEYWSGLPFPSPGNLPDPGIEPGSPAFQADVLTSEPAMPVVLR